jgi:hypothetical protein
VLLGGYSPWSQTPWSKKVLAHMVDDACKADGKVGNPSYSCSG